MRADNRRTDREPQTKTALLGREEGLKESWKHFSGYSAASVGYKNLDRLRGGARRDAKNAVMRRGRHHGLDCVQHEIKQHLLKLHGIASYQWQVRLQLTE